MLMIPVTLRAVVMLARADRIGGLGLGGWRPYASITVLTTRVHEIVVGAAYLTLPLLLVDPAPCRISHRSPSEIAVALSCRPHSLSKLHANANGLEILHMLIMKLMGTGKQIVKIV